MRPRHFAAKNSSKSREKQLKEWKRDWKINLLERDNPHWLELYPSLRL